MQSKDTVRDASRTQERNSFLDYISKTLPSNFSDDLLIGFKLDDLYNHFEVSLTGFEVRHVALFIILFYAFNIHQNQW